MYYAVARGKRKGVYKTWTEAKAQIDGFKGAKYKKFDNESDAKAFVSDMNAKTVDILKFCTVESEEPPENALIVFTDGACSDNGKKGARASFACVWPYNPELNHGEALSVDQLQTNNRGELSGLLHAMRQADEVDPERKKTLNVYTDSQLVINSIGVWLSGWKRNNWIKSDGKPVLNTDLLKAIDELKGLGRKLVLKHVRAHTGQNTWEALNNDAVDRLAKEKLITA